MRKFLTKLLPVLFCFITLSQINFAQTDKQGLRVGIAVDNSGSLRTKFDSVLAIGVNVVENLKPEDQAFVLRFISKDKITLLQDWTEDVEVLQSAVEEMYVEGGRSATTDAVYASAEKLIQKSKEEPKENYVLILITDGEDTEKGIKPAKLFDLVRGKNIKICPLAFVNEAENKLKATNYVNKLASETGGTATLLTNTAKEELENSVKSLFDQLRGAKKQVSTTK